MTITILWKYPALTGQHVNSGCIVESSSSWMSHFYCFDLFFFERSFLLSLPKIPAQPTLWVFGALTKKTTTSWSGRDYSDYSVCLLASTILSPIVSLSVNYLYNLYLFKFLFLYIEPLFGQMHLRFFSSNFLALRSLILGDDRVNNWDILYAICVLIVYSLIVDELPPFSDIISWVLWNVKLMIQLI